MTAHASTSRTSIDTLRALVRIGAVPPRRLLLTAGLGTAAALSTVALMASSGALIDKAAFRPPLYTLTVLMAAVQIFALCRGPLRYSERVVSHDASFGVLGRLRLWLFDHLEAQSPAGVRRWRGGDLLARATGDIDTLQDLYLRGITPMVVAGITSLFAVALLSAVLPLAGLLAASGLGCALGATSFIAWRRHHGLGGEVATWRGKLAADTVELLRGAPDLVAFGLDDAYLERALSDDDALARLARRRAWTAGSISATSNLLLGATVVGLLAVGISAVDARRLPAFMLAVLPLVAFGAFEVVTPAADAVSRLSEQVAAGDRLLDIADLPPPVTDPAEAARPPAGRDISLEDVRMRYGSGDPWVLDGVSLRVPTGRRVALLGASGAGKSSLVSLLLRFWARDGGSLTIGGTSVDRLAQDATREMIGWVAQDTHLFNSTIRANIALARPEATEAEIVAVARASQLGGWIDSLPLGLDTEVGEEGVLVSGGQRQRIALARALLADPTILVLDEPTAGLDEQTASRLLEDLLATTGGKTLIYITHRAGEVAAFDDVYTMADGRVAGPQRPGEPDPKER